MTIDLTPAEALAAPPADPHCAGVFSALLERCARGDESAMEALFDAFLPVVLAVVHRRTASTAPSSTTDDRVVGAFLRIWHRAPLFDPATTSAVEWILDQARWSDDPGPPLPLTAVRAC